MFKLLIFGGTTEGRRLAEYCAENGLDADVSVATEYGASLLPEGISVLCGRLGAEQMTELIRGGYSAVIDATHPYAVEATKNIRDACTNADTKYLRLKRTSSETVGKTVSDMAELVDELNRSDDAVLSTLGSKSLGALTKVRDFADRLWIRVLPSNEITELCRTLGYDMSKVIQDKGPFTAEQNAAHLKKSKATILITKECGETGGYLEKVKAARACGAELITLVRPSEDGFSFDEILEIIEKERRK